MKQRCRNWTNEETELFATILADEENQFALPLERLAPKKAANNEVFEHVKCSFNKERVNNDFKKMNEENTFTNDKGELQKYPPLDASILKLRRKYTGLKAEWRKISDRAKKGSGLAPEREPNWYKILNPVFAETNVPLDLVADSADISLDDNESDTQHDINESDAESDEEEEKLANHKEHDPNVENNCSKSKPKLVVAPHKKRKVVRSQNQGLSQLAKSMEELASSQIKRAKLMIEADRKSCF